MDRAVPPPLPGALALLRNRVTLVWVALVLATIVSWWLGTDHGLDDATAASVVILVIAMLKVRCVGLYFMDLRHAPTALRGVFEAYCLGLLAALVGLYLFS